MPPPSTQKSAEKSSISPAKASYARGLMRFLLGLCAMVQPLLAVTCRGIVLLGQEAPLVEGAQEGVTAVGIEVPGRLLSVLERFLGEAIDAEALQGAVERFYGEGAGLVEVVVPEQEVTLGVVQVRIEESTVGCIEVVGAKHVSQQLLRNYLDVENGDRIDATRLKQGVDFMNRNPFRRVDLIYSAGDRPLTTDLELVVEDRRPYRFYTGTNNSGVSTTERGRFVAGVNWAQIGRFDQFFTYQYTASYDFSHLQAHAAQWMLYFPWRHYLNLYGGYSTVHVDLSFPGSRNHGASYQASGRYNVTLPPTQLVYHEVGAGFDFKRTNNTLEFSETFPLIASNVNLSQFALRYGGNVAKATWRLDFEGEAFWSPGAILGDESNAAYQTLRPFAENHWLYGRGMLKYFQKLSSYFFLNLMARGQLSSQNLLPSEQLGLGGVDSVRGYDERQLNYDSGLILNAELLTAAIPVIGAWKSSCKDALQFLGFVDYGYGSNHTPIPGERKRDHLLGIGPGVRYTLDPWIAARLDLGVKLHREEGFTGGSAMWYFSVTASL